MPKKISTPKPATASTDTATPADVKEAAALPPTVHPRAHLVMTSQFAPLAEPAARAAIGKHAATLKALGAPVTAKALLADVDLALRLAAVHARLQQAADRVHAVAERAATKARADANIVAEKLSVAGGGVLADDFAGFLDAHGAAIGLDLRATNLRAKKKAKKKAAK